MKKNILPLLFLTTSTVFGQTNPATPNTSTTPAAAPTSVSSYSQMINKRGASTFGGYSWSIPNNINNPVSMSLFTPHIALSSDAKSILIQANHYLGKLDQLRSTWLQIQVSENGVSKMIPLMELENNISNNPTNYYSKSEFKVNIEDINKKIKELAPNSNLSIEAGSSLYLQTFYPEFQHLWGGSSRNGLITVPGVSHSKNSESIRPKDLDLAFSIQSDWASPFNNFNTGKGLQMNGQIRSRLEGEGKFQIPNDQYLKLRENLFKLANNETEAKKIFGDDWELKLEERYMSKDQKTGEAVKDQHGYPIPDPMIDTYYDNKNLDAAKKDIALRYRWTEGNRSGAWNFKPGIGRVTKSGVVYRIEYGVDTNDNTPESIANFANSDHPLNPFKTLNTNFPGQKASDFLIPSVKLTDYRYKEPVPELKI